MQFSIAVSQANHVYEQRDRCIGIAPEGGGAVGANTGVLFPRIPGVTSAANQDPMKSACVRSRKRRRFLDPAPDQFSL